MQKTFMKATSDLFIKYLFGTEEENELLISFINAVFDDSGFSRIVSLELKNPFNLKKHYLDKGSVLDIKAVDDTGKIFNIEMQTQGDSHFINRSLFYWARIYSSQLNKSEIWNKLKPVVCINSLDFNLFPDIMEFHSCFMLKERINPNRFLSDHLYIHFLEIKKLTKHKNYSKLELWLNYLKKEGTEDRELMDIINNNPDMSKAHKRYVKFTHDEMMRDLYESKINWQRDQKTMKESAVKKALAESKKEIARNLLKEGFDIDQISRTTGLSNSEIEELK